MEIRINKVNNFKNDIRSLYSIIDNNSFRPILSCFYFKLNNSKLEIVASNETISVKKTINPINYSTSNKDDEFIINAKIFENIIHSIKDNEIIIKVTEDNSLYIKSLHSEYFLNLFIEEKYPIINFNNNSENNFKLNSNDLNNAIKKTVFAASDNDQRIILNGINIKTKDNNLVFTSTDSYRISRYKSKIKTDREISETVHIKAMKEINKLINKDTTLDISINSDWFYIKNSEVIIKSKVIDGIFPNVDRVFPKEFKNTIKIKKNELLNAIDSALVINNMSDEINIKLSDGAIIIKNEEVQIGNAFSKTNNFEFIGENKSISFSINPKFLIEAVKSFNDSELKLQINDSFKPLIISSDSEPQNYNLIQPLKT